MHKGRDTNPILQAWQVHGSLVFQSSPHSSRLLLKNSCHSSLSSTTSASSMSFFSHRLYPSRPYIIQQEESRSGALPLIPSVIVELTLRSPMPYIAISYQVYDQHSHICCAQRRGPGFLQTVWFTHSSVERPLQLVWPLIPETAINVDGYVQEGPSHVLCAHSLSHTGKIKD
jgi:hypothetical protein